jgi:hypothetical protein
MSGSTPKPYQRAVLGALRPRATGATATALATAAPTAAAAPIATAAPSAAAAPNVATAATAATAAAAPIAAAAATAAAPAARSSIVGAAELREQVLLDDVQAKERKLDQRTQRLPCMNEAQEEEFKELESLLASAIATAASENASVVRECVWTCVRALRCQRAAAQSSSTLHGVPGLQVARRVSGLQVARRLAGV